MRPMVASSRPAFAFFGCVVCVLHELSGFGGRLFFVLAPKKYRSWRDGGYTASRATIFLGNVVRAPHARARTSHWSMGG